MTKFKKGDWVEVRPEHDIPAILRNNQPTIGRIEDVYDDPRPEAGEPFAGVVVPIGDDPIDEHSQYVPYPLAALVPTDRRHD